MKSLRPVAGIGRLCGLFGMTRQAWYEHSWNTDDRRMWEEEILEKVRKKRKDGRFGARTLLRMIGPELAERGIQIGRDRLLDLLRDHGMLVRPLRRHVSTTNSRHHYRKWPYLLEGLEITQAEQVWVCDITYIRSKGGFLYLFLITDAYSHKVMGYHLSHTMEAKGAVAALRMALSRRMYPGRKLIHHSDRGVQYCSTHYVKALEEAGIEISMTEGASPHQNTIAERINRTFKEQLYMGQVFEGYKQAMAQLVAAVDVYNHRRPHTSCSGLTPERAHEATEPLQREWKNYKKERQSAEALAALHTSRQV
jgi:putative transposase